MSESPKYASRAGLKLDGALAEFEISVTDAICADFGCNVGGFTDCLLARGAQKVYAIDTGYGTLAWKLRKDDRVVVMERTNALYADVAEPVDLVVIDVAWTPQKLSIPAAVKWLKPGGIIISLLKPVFELAKQTDASGVCDGGSGRKKGGKKRKQQLTDAQSHQICSDVCEQLTQAGYSISAITQSVLTGKGGNHEYLLLIRT